MATHAIGPPLQLSQKANFMISFDIMNLPKDFVPNAYEYFEQLRQESPIHWNSDGSLILTRYEDIVAVYRNPDVWSSEKKSVFKPKFGAQSLLYEHHTTSLVFRDPPDHTRIRRLFQPRSLVSSRQFRAKITSLRKNEHLIHSC